MTKYQKEDLPYAQLERFGITREMIEDLPKKVIETMLNGIATPVFSLRYKADDGKVYVCKSRLKVTEGDDGKLYLLFIPKKKACDLSILPNEKLYSRLRDGEPVFARNPVPDEESKVHMPQLYQIDKATNQLVSVPLKLIVNNLEVLQQQFGLQNYEIDQLRNGYPVTVEMETDGVQMTIGVDLSEESCICIVKGGQEEWKSRHKEREKEYEFGFSGCWITEASGEMEYVAEQDFDVEMKELLRQDMQKRKFI